ncbi:MAG: ORF6N domain-containing protein [Prolixibacteraceae bacterium]|nr:ORF6N domain-containing protein [Prolixibacteraceae bacterium]
MSNPESALVIPDETIVSKIYLIRESKVMLDSDLAELYGVETRRLNEQVKRNLSRFPEDFMFQLSEDEFNNLSST